MLRKKHIHTLFAVCFFIFININSFSQAVAIDSTKKDTVKKVDARLVIKPYEQVVTKNFTTKKGLLTVHQYKDTIYFEIPDSLLGRDIEVINRLEKGPGGTGFYAGEQLDERTIQFEHKTADSSIRIRYVWVISSADPESNIYRAVTKSNLNPVAISFPIKAYGKNQGSYVIDVSKYIKDKISLFNSIDLRSNLAKTVNTGNQKDIAIESVHAYPINVEITLSKNADIKTSQFYPQGTPVTLVTHTSFIVLPAIPMQQRIADNRVGFFADYVYHYGDNQQKVEERKFILRWRLEPKEEDIDKWRKGKLVEPKKPIVIYLDPATPKQWRKYLIAGINDWQKAFEQAGFKNAIIGKEWPENDSTMQLDDARYSILNYLPSEIENAYGPQVHDPRSGEIIQTRIGWYHNVMQLLHDWYMIQAAAVDPKARHAKFDDELMGELIRFVSSHEVGHTLGLRHNFGSSSKTPVDSLRSKSYLAKYGHTSSIMDYARFNYVAQPEDNIPQANLFPGIGEYDKWAVEWAYKSSGAKNLEEDKKITKEWIVDRTGKNPRLWFGDGEEKKTDPRCQTEDLSDNAVKASEYGIKNLKRILPNLPEWTKEEGGIHEALDKMYKTLQDQYTRYMQHVIKNIGGTYTTLRSEEDAKPVYEPVAKSMQKEAIIFFNEQLFKTPTWLLDEKVISKVSEPAQPNFVEDLQVKVLNSLLDIKKIDQLLANQRRFGDKALGVDEYISTIHRNIWSELKIGKVDDPYRRNLQKSYVGNLQNILLSTGPDQTETDVSSILRADLLQLQDEITAALSTTINDNMTKYHLLDMQDRIKKTLAANLTIQ